MRRKRQVQVTTAKMPEADKNHDDKNHDDKHHDDKNNDGMPPMMCPCHVKYETPFNPDGPFRPTGFPPIDPGTPTHHDDHDAHVREIRELKRQIWELQQKNGHCFDSLKVCGLRLMYSENYM